MKKSYEKALSFMLSLVLVIGMLAAIPFTESPFTFLSFAASNGVCGDNVSWTMDDEGTLTISGTGDMYNYAAAADTPWGSEGLTIKNIVIKDGVTSIGDFAFSGNGYSLISVSIPDSVTTIGNYAFAYNRDSFVSITSLKNVTRIGDFAFSNCDGLTSIPVAENLVSIGERAFVFCSGLSSITISDSVTDIASDAFYSCQNLKEIHISDLTKWCVINFADDYSNPLYYAEALYLNGNLITDLIVPDGVTSISPYAFYGCNSFVSVTIPESLISIGKFAFKYCDNLKAVHISDIAKWCEIDMDPNYSNPLYIAQNLYLNGELVTDLVIPEGVTSIDGYAFYGCKSITSVTIPESLIHMGQKSFYFCENLNAVYISDLVNWFEIEFGLDGWISGFSNPLYYADNLYLDGELVTDLVIPESITSINALAMRGCKSIVSVTIHEGVTSVGANAFEFCENLENVYISDLAKWCEIDFETTSSNPLYHADNLYINGKPGIDLVIPDGVTTIKDHAFNFYTNLNSVVLSNSVKNICEGVFYECINLTKITLSDNLESIGRGAFYNCSKLAEMNIPDSVTSLGTTVFGKCSSLEEVIIPDGVTCLNGQTFWESENLKKVVIPAGVTSLDDFTFVKCPNVTVYCFPNSAAHKYCKSKMMKYVLYQLTGVGETTVDSDNKVIFTDAYNSDSVSDFLTVSGYTAQATASDSGGNLGTASSVDIYREGKLEDEYKLIVVGDLNGDSVCDAIDVAEAERVSNGHKTAVTEQVYAANGAVSEEIDVASYQNVVNVALAS